jgi:hypothetical protein
MEEIEQQFPFWATYYRYHLYRNSEPKPIAKFNSNYEATRFINAIHEQEKSWNTNNYYRLVFLGKTQITL